MSIQANSIRRVKGEVGGRNKPVQFELPLPANPVEQAQVKPKKMDVQVACVVQLFRVELAQKFRAARSIKSSEGFIHKAKNS